MTAGMSWQFPLMSLSSKSLIRVFTHIQRDSGKELFWHESKGCAQYNSKLSLTCQCLYRANYLLLACYLTCFVTVRGLLLTSLWFLYQNGFRILLFRDMLWCRLVNCQCGGQISYWGQIVRSRGSCCVNIWGQTRELVSDNNGHCRSGHRGCMWSGLNCGQSFYWTDL